jgi:hypothetical protein
MATSDAGSDDGIINIGSDQESVLIYNDGGYEPSEQGQGESESLQPDLESESERVPDNNSAVDEIWPAPVADLDHVDKNTKTAMESDTVQFDEEQSATAGSDRLDENAEAVADAGDAVDEEAEPYEPVVMIEEENPVPSVVAPTTAVKLTEPTDPREIVSTLPQRKANTWAENVPMWCPPWSWKLT